MSFISSMSPKHNAKKIIHSFLTKLCFHCPLLSIHFHESKNTMVKILVKNKLCMLYTLTINFSGYGTNFHKYIKHATD